MMWELSWRIKIHWEQWLTESTVRKIWFYVLPFRLLSGGFSSNACDDLRNKKQKFSLLPDHRLLSARLADECHMLLYVLKAYHVLFFSCLSPPPSYIIYPPSQSHRKTFNEINFPLPLFPRRPGDVFCHTCYSTWRSLPTNLQKSF